MIRKNHHFFSLNFNLWPLVISLNCINLFFSLVIFFKKMVLTNFLFGLLILSFWAFSWWLNYRGEFNVSGSIRRDLDQGLKFSMLLFISSEVFFFFSFFWAYFHFFLSPCLEARLIWPCSFTKIFDYSNVPMLNTLILLGSGVTITIRHFFIVKGEKTLSIFWSFLTGAMGLLFTALQAQEYRASFFSLRDGRFGTSFFMLTGFHGLHVIIGTTFIIINAVYFFKFSFCKDRVLRFEMASWYWHFVDVVWIFLFFFLYYINF